MAKNASQDGDAPVFLSLHAGISNQNSAPAATSVKTPMRPPCSSTIALLIAKPAQFHL
jgi:hypothetical protein